MSTQYKPFLASAALLFGVFTFTGLPAARAQEAESFDDLSLEALLSVEVVTASKSAERLSDAPGAVSVITAREIEQFGSTSLLEVLERVPGVYAIGTSGFPQGMLSIRGDAATTINAHVLVLLDGRPMRESLHGGLNTALYTAFPVESIERIEVVRGPGSVLYGSNAYAGVVNIITKQGGDANGAALHTSAGYGSFAARSFAAQASYRQDALSVSGGVRLFRDENKGEYTAWLPGETPGSFTRVVQNAGQVFNLGEDAVGATLSARYKGLSFRSFAGFTDQSLYGGGFGGTASKPSDFRHVTTDLGYERALAPWWDASANVTFNYDRQLHNGADEMNRDVIVEATSYLRPFEKANVVVGGLVYALHGSSEMDLADFMNPAAPPTHVTLIAPFDATWWSAYSQLDFRPIDRVKLIAGGQVNKVEGLDLDFVPRLGAIFNATDAVGAKLLYGQAFRSPYAVERTINVPGMRVGNPSLRPEKVTSLDAQVFYNTGHLQLAATYFNARQRDLIVQKLAVYDPVTFALISPATYENKGELTIQGVELESKVAPNDHLFFTGSFVYQASEDGDGVGGTTLVPSVVAKAGVSYTLPAGVTLGLFDSFFNAPTSLYDLEPQRWVDPATGAFNPEASGMNPEPEAFHYLTAKVSVDVTKVMRLHRFPAMQLDFYATNLLGDKLYVSDIDLTNLSVPRQEGRSFYGAFRVAL